MDTTRTTKIPDIATELNFLTILRTFVNPIMISMALHFIILRHRYGNTHRNDFAMEKPSFWSYVNNQLFSYSQKQALDKLSLDQTITFPENRPYLHTFLDEDHACGIASLPESWEFLDLNGKIVSLFEQWKKIMGLTQDDEEINKSKKVSGEKQKV
ncbi:uncharacterized protein Bfra_002193 [Botrytis fragariae]|uniref:Uncharacterized protein n=1 Tax=Botrytis fragariae TaxID=1964551 RepID=A0A8H6B1P8_9HELO|nr:uncharacterized protein Bfra_002193 [Botrytis fragariae]KAF5877823.1 hypothetical protein Bfra_002193 [Botrytis fragariae]